MSDDAFYVRTGPQTFEPTAATVGPWDAGLQHGGPIAALLATAIDATSPRAGTRIGHFALEFLSPAALAPMRVATEIVRPGKKVELLAATVAMAQHGQPERVALRATAWRLATEAGRCPAVN